ncbi:retrovirus-related pol polyprotein from transposon TNT 1-94 [Tanacetum coccineum]
MHQHQKHHFQPDLMQLQDTKAKEIAKPITPPSESAFEETGDPEQALQDKDKQRIFGFSVASTFKNLYKPTNNNLRTSFKPARNKNVDYSPRLSTEQSDWLADTDEEIDEQELEAHYSYMAKIQEWKRVIVMSLLTYQISGDNDIQDDQNDVECDDEQFKALKKANATLTQELTECKSILAETSRTLGESNSIRDSCLVALQNKQTEFERTLNVNDCLCTCGKLLCLNLNHDACVSKFINDVNARTKKPKVVPISTRKPKVQRTNLCNTHKKNIASKSTLTNSKIVTKSYYRMLYKNTSKAWKWWIAQQCPSAYTWVPKTKRKWVPKVRNESVTKKIVQLILFIVDSGCTKHMTGNLSLLCNFVEKYLGTVRFGNDQFAPILGYGDLVQGNITIKRVYYVEGLNHNLFSVGQFCDADLEVAFRKSTCFVRDLQGNDLLTGNRGTDLYTISLQETTSSTPICLMAKASPTQAWLWHRRLSHLNFDYINLLSKKDVVIGLPKLKYVKDQLCSSCEVSKAKRSSFKSKTVPSSKGRLNLLHMDLCGPMRVASINGKKYILVIVDDYSRYTWTLFLRSKDETPEVLKDFLTMIQRNLQAPVISVRTDRGTEFLNKTLNVFFKEEGIEHQTSTPRTPEQNSVVERRNCTLIEAAQTMLSASKLPLFFWAEAIATACYTQNRSIIIPTHEKTAYHIINDIKPLIKHLHIFGCTCYLTRDGENLDKMKERGDPCILVGYSTQSKGYHVYNKRTRLIVESIHLRFDEIKEMLETSVANDTSGLVPQ